MGKRKLFNNADVRTVSVFKYKFLFYFINFATNRREIPQSLSLPYEVPNNTF